MKDYHIFHDDVDEKPIKTSLRDVPSMDAIFMVSICLETSTSALVKKVVVESHLTDAMVVVAVVLDNVYSFLVSCIDSLV